MSYPYRVKLTETCSETVSSNDSITQKISLENFLPEEEMKDILSKILIKNGFKEKGKRYIKKREDGEVFSLDIEKMELKTTVAVSKNVKIEKRRTVTAKKDGDRMSEKEKDDFKKGESLSFKKQVKKDLKSRVDSERLKIEKEIVKILVENKEARQKEINDIVMEVYKEALLTKSRQMGSVEEIRESGEGEDYELMIKISN